MLHVIVHAADIQDRDGGGMLIATLFGLHPFLTRLYADAGHQAPRFADALKQAMGQMQVEIIKRSELHQFVVLPKRWLVERTIAWLNHCPRLAKYWENHSRNALAFLQLASIILMLRKLCTSNVNLPDRLSGCRAGPQSRPLPPRRFVEPSADANHFGTDGAPGRA